MGPSWPKPIRYAKARLSGGDEGAAVSEDVSEEECKDGSRMHVVFCYDKESTVKNRQPVETAI